MPKWTPIATRRRKGYAPIWRPVKDAPMTVAAARRAFDRGGLFMAHRIADEDTLELVVLKARRKQPATGYFLTRQDRFKKPENTL